MCNNTEAYSIQTEANIVQTKSTNNAKAYSIQAKTNIVQTKATNNTEAYSIQAKSTKTYFVQWQQQHTETIQATKLQAKRQLPMGAKWQLRFVRRRLPRS